MINCQHVMTRLWQYLDGELPPEEGDALREHLAHCARCYPQYRYQLGFLALISRAAATAGPSEEFVTRLRQALASVES